FIISLAMLIYSLIVNALGNTAWGWTSIVMSIWLLGGLQLLAIGVIGEYVGKSYLETKKRPKYIIETVLKD
ncbi:MAG: glucosyltransferase, partial [Christensenellaceae bacterium]